MVLSRQLFFSFLTGSFFIASAGLSSMAEVETPSDLFPSSASFLSQSPLSPSDYNKSDSTTSAPSGKKRRFVKYHHPRRLNVSVKRPHLDNLNTVPENLRYGDASRFPIDGYGFWCYAGMTRSQREFLKNQRPGYIVSPFKKQKTEETPLYSVNAQEITPEREEYRAKTRKQYKTLKELLFQAATPEMVLSHFRAYLQKCQEEGIRPDLERSVRALRKCQGHFNVVMQFGDHLFLAQTNMFDLKARDKRERTTLERLERGLNPLMKGESKYLRDRVCNYHHAVQEAGPVVAIPEWDHSQSSDLYHQFLDSGEGSRIDRRDFAADCKEFNRYLYDFLRNGQAPADPVNRALRF